MDNNRRSRKRTRDDDDESSEHRRDASNNSKRSKHKKSSRRRRTRSKSRRRQLDEGVERQERESPSRAPTPASLDSIPVAVSTNVSNTQPLINTAPNEPGQSSISSDNLLLAFRELIQSMKPDNSSERFPNLNVIPEFDPAKRNQTIDMWITKVNECASIYTWTERQIIHYALPKLTGLAQKWYQGLPSLLFSWAEWQSKLKLAFPSHENYGQLLTDMLACKARYGESLEEYFYEKMVLLNRCHITGKDAIDCILFGIEDRSVRTSAEAAQFAEPDRLLVYLRNVKMPKKVDRNNAPLQSGSSDSRRPRGQQSRNTPNGTDVKYKSKCYNCGEEGHPFYRCAQPIKRCDNCRKVGHLSSECPLKLESANKTVLRISQELDNDLKYFKTALVNGHKLDCFVDFGSQCTILCESIARKLTDSWSMSDLPVIRGFGNSVVNCLGKCQVEVEVDSAKASLEALVVPDHLLRVPLLLGQTFTEQEHVMVFKNSKQLTITAESPDPNKPIHLYVSRQETITGYTELEVYSVPAYTGNVLVEPSLCQQAEKQYEIIQSVIRFHDGQGTMVIKGLGTDFVLTKDTLLVRAIPLKEIQCFDVNRIMGCPDDEVVSNIESHMIRVNESIDKKHIEVLTNILNEFRDTFAFSTKELGRVKETEMEIKLHDTTPVVYRPYRLPHSEREIMRGMISDLEEAGIVEPSSSDYASPVILVRKKTGDYRLCIDFRALNKKTVKEHYPIPRIDDQLDSLSNYKFYTTLDLASGYYQIPMSSASKHLTAFITLDGHYEFSRMPFGLVNAPSTFQKTINRILGNARFKEAFAYMDDVIIPSKTVEEGIQRLRNILNVFRSSGLTLKLSKCNFLMQTIDYLGFEVSEEGVKPGKKKIEAVTNFPRPTDQHRVRQFIGLASFFRRFVRSFSSIAKPLTNLLKKNSKWQWGDAEEQAFIILKEQLTKRPILSFYNPKYETQLHTDASKAGIAGILLQRPDKDTPFSVVAYYSRQTSPEEMRFTSYDLETLAVVNSLQRFRVYLLGIHFTIVTDCNSVRATFEKRDTIPRVARWWSILQEFDFEIIYKPGTTLTHVDALSRNPSPCQADLQVRAIDASWLSTVQQSDSELQRIVEILNDEDTKYTADIRNNFVVKRGLLYRKTEDGDRWVVPKGVRWQVMKTCHDEIGHFGFDKTFDKVKSSYWFAKMRKFTKKYVESCLECAHTKAPAGKRAGELHPIEKVNRPFHTLHIDHLGPFVRSKRRNSYLLLIIDAFTKFIVLVPVKSTKAVHSIRAVKDFFHTFSVPKRLISDRGTSFTAKRFQEFLSSLGVKHILNAVATPRANGQIERYNRTVLSALSATNFGKSENVWDECVSEIQWGLNNTLNKGIGRTPAQALFGFDLIGTPGAPLQLNLDDDSENANINLEETRKEISEHIKENQQKQKERFDKKRKPAKFKLGELVRVEREIPSTGSSRKLIPKLRGPYRIAKVLDHDRYVVEDTPLSRKGSRLFTGVFPIDKIHPWLVYNRADVDPISSDESE